MNVDVLIFSSLFLQREKNINVPFTAWAHIFHVKIFSLQSFLSVGVIKGWGYFSWTLKTGVSYNDNTHFFLDSIQFLGSAPWNTDTTTFLFSCYIFRIQSCGVHVHTFYSVTNKHTLSQSIIWNVILAGVRVFATVRCEWVRN